MSIIRGFKFPQVFLVIVFLLISLTTLSSIGYCGEWIYVGKTDMFTQYYRSSSIKIDKQNKIIKVWAKFEWTDKGKTDYLKYVKDRKSFNDINHSLNLILMNYKDWRYSITNIVSYSKSGKVLEDIKLQPEWDDIIPDSLMEFVTNHILKDNNIQR